MVTKRRRSRSAHTVLRDRHLLRAAMMRQHYNVRQTAALVGCHPSMIGHLLSGYHKTCTPRLAMRIERELRVPPGSLFDVRAGNLRLSA